MIVLNRFVRVCCYRGSKWKVKILDSDIDDI